MGSERFNQAILSLDMPAWAFTENGVQLLPDGNMEAAGTANWSMAGVGTLAKSSLAPHSGLQCLRMSGNPGAVAGYPAVPNQVVGRTYRLTGWVRGDGLGAIPRVYDTGVTILFTGTTANVWQYFDVTYVAAGVTSPYFWLIGAAGYIEFDDFRLEWLPASTRNLGSLGNYAQLGDGVTPATFPTQLAPTHGMSFDGANDYLLRAEATNELTFTDPAQFSVEALCVRTSIQIGSTYALFCKNGGGGGLSAPYMLYLQNVAGVMQILWATVSGAGASRGILATALGSYWPAGVTTHVVGTFDGTTWQIFLNAVQAFSNVAAGCYAPDAAGASTYVGTFRFGSGALLAPFGGKIYNAAIYPFALQPGEVASLYQLRRSMINRGF
jgi:hypothetical protein